MSIRNLALLVFFGLIVLLLQLRPNGDVDVFWRVKTGELALRQGELIRTDPFTSTRAGEPVAPLSWLSEILYAVLYRVGSWRLLLQVNALVFAAALLIAAWTVRRQETSATATLVAVSLGLVVALPHCQIRSQSFAIMWFALLLWIVHSELRPRRKLLLSVVVMVVWQNMHPSVMIGAVALAAVASAGWLRWLFDHRAAKPWVPTAMVLLAVLCTMATPMGASIFETSAVNTRLSRELQISEWMPIWHPAARAAAMSVYVVLLVSAVLLVRVGRRARLEDVAVFVVLAAVSLPMYRFSLFFGVAMVPVWSRWIAAALPLRLPAEGDEVEVGRLRAAGIVVAVLLGALLLPPLLRTRLFDREIPLAAAERLGELGTRGVVYNYREWGGPLIWASRGRWKVTIDGRLYLFTPEDWRRYRQIALGRVPVAQVEKWYHPDAFFLRPGFHERFIRLLRQSENWEQSHADQNAVVFTRR